LPFVAKIEGDRCQPNCPAHAHPRTARTSHHRPAATASATSTARRAATTRTLRATDSGGPALSQGQRQGGQALLYRQCTDREPPWGVAHVVPVRRWCANNTSRRGWFLSLVPDRKRQRAILGGLAPRPSRRGPSSGGPTQACGRDPDARTSVPLPRDTSRLGDGTRRLLLLG
jgi:hypothetical protein